MDQQAIIVRMTKKIIQLMEIQPAFETVVFLSDEKIGDIMELVCPKFHTHFIINKKILESNYVIGLLKKAIISDDQINFNILFVALYMCKELIHDQESLVDDEEITLSNKVRELVFSIFPYVKDLQSIILQI